MKRSYLGLLGLAIAAVLVVAFFGAGGQGRTDAIGGTTPRPLRGIDLELPSDSPRQKARSIPDAGISESPTGGSPERDSEVDSWDDAEELLRSLALSDWNETLGIRRDMFLGFSGGPFTAEYLRNSLKLSDAVDAEALAEEINIKNADVDAELAALADQYLSALDSAYLTLLQEGSYEHAPSAGFRPAMGPDAVDPLVVETVRTRGHGWVLTVKVDRGRFPVLGDLRDLQAPLVAERRRNLMEAIRPYRESEPNAKFWPMH